MIVSRFSDRIRDSKIVRFSHSRLGYTAENQKSFIFLKGCSFVSYEISRCAFQFRFYALNVILKVAKWLRLLLYH